MPWQTATAIAINQASRCSVQKLVAWNEQWSPLAFQRSKKAVETCSETLVKVVSGHQPATSESTNFSLRVRS